MLIRPVLPPLPQGQLHVSAQIPGICHTDRIAKKDSHRQDIGIYPASTSPCTDAIEPPRWKRRQGCGRLGKLPLPLTNGNSIFVIRSHPGSHVFMDHFFGRHMVRMDLITSQSLCTVELRVEDIVCISLIGGADLQPLETGNHTHQGLQRLGDLLHRSLLVAVFPQLIDDNVLHHNIHSSNDDTGAGKSQPRYVVCLIPLPEPRPGRSAEREWTERSACSLHPRR